MGRIEPGAAPDGSDESDPGRSSLGRSSLGRSVGRRIDDLGDGLDQVEEALADAKARVEGQVIRSPYTTLAAAIGVGYVLGGGLFTPFTARVVGGALRLGLRVAVLPLLQQELAVVAQEALGLRAPPSS